MRSIAEPMPAASTRLGADQQRLVVAAVQGGLDDQRAQNLADPVSGGEDGDGSGNAQVPSGGEGQRGDPDEGGPEQAPRLPARPGPPR